MEGKGQPPMSAAPASGGSMKRTVKSTGVDPAFVAHFSTDMRIGVARLAQRGSGKWRGQYAFGRSGGVIYAQLPQLPRTSQQFGMSLISGEVSTDTHIRAT